MKAYVDNIVENFGKVVLSLYIRKHPNEDIAEFKQKLEEFKFYVHDEIYRGLNKHNTFIFNTNFRNDFAQNHHQIISLSDRIEMHLIDVFYKNYNDIIGSNMNIVVFGNKEFSQIMVEGFYNGKKRTFKKADVFYNSNEQTK